MSALNGCAISTPNPTVLTKECSWVHPIYYDMDEVSKDVDEQLLAHNILYEALCEKSGD